MDTSSEALKYRAEREHMVREQIAGRGVRDERVLAAMRDVPRELFLPPDLADAAYDDNAVAIDCAQTISQPYMVALMTELLAPTGRILEIGTGSGYQTAILARLATQVYTIEWHLALMTKAAERFRALDIRNVSCRCSDGTLGWPEHAPFDGIMVTAGAPEFPPALREQLDVGGRLVIPVGPLADQTLYVVQRTASGFVTKDSIRCRFVKLVGAAGWTP